MFLVGITFPLMLGGVSCNNELPCDEKIGSVNRLNATAVNTVSVNDTIIKKLDFYYKGTHYVSDYSSLNDSIIEIFDDEVRMIYFSFSENSEVVTYVHPEGNIEYFDNWDMMRSSLVEKRKPRRVARDLPIISRYGRFYLYDDVGFKDRMIIVEEYGDQIVPHLKYYRLQTGEYANFNDKTSSLKIDFGRDDLFYKFWEDDHYSGRCLVLRTTRGRKEVRNLKDYPLVGSSKSWNDRITSISIDEKP